MVFIVFESHATTLDNEVHLASGHFDVALSPLGMQQAAEMGRRYEKAEFDAVFCSDLQRSYMTAELAFGKRFGIIRDARLRECDYGDLTRHPSYEVDVEKPNRIKVPFPNGESYEQTNQRMQRFLEEMADKYDGKRILIVGHRATQYALESLVLGKSIEESIKTPWQWQPGWIYELKRIT